jgi:hypothetical protein
MAWEEPRKTGMLYRRVGNSGLHVSVLGLGGWLTYVEVLHNLKMWGGLDFKIC